MSSHHETIPDRPMSRRSLIKALAASTVAIGLGTAVGTSAASAIGSLGQAAAPSGGRNRLVPVNRIGIQLYTVRDKVSSLGFRAVFEELADIGYSEVEFAGYTQGTGPITPAEIRQLLDDNGLRAVGCHLGLGDLRNNLQQNIEIAHTLGMPHMGTANAPTNVRTVAGYLAAAEEFNGWGEQVTAAGLKLYQHNHDGEFSFATDQPEVRLYDVFLDNTNERDVYLEMDVYWAYVGQHRYPGFEPIDYVTKHPRRYPLLHLKDGKTNTGASGYDIIEFGEGDIPYQQFLSVLRDRGQRFGIYEQDNAGSSAVPPNEVNSLGNARRSYTSIYGLRG